MIPLVTREASRRLDADAVERLGLPSMVLMENAGRGATEELVGRFDTATPVLVGGTGQNGGDAWVVARHLHDRGIAPRCVLVGAVGSVGGDARTQLDVLDRLGILVETLSPDATDLRAQLRPIVTRASVVVDGLFGTGLSRPVVGGYRDAIEVINASGVPVLALDLPSGIDANTGAILGAAIRASATVTFASHKRGLHQEPGAIFAGHLALATIGVPALPTAESSAFRVERTDLAQWLPRRDGANHKGRAGHVLAVAGSEGKTGAAYLAAYAALRGGAGLVTVATTPAAAAALDHKVVEIMTTPLGIDEAATALALAAGKKAALVGPGLGLDERARALAVDLAERLELPTVLDADALTAIADTDPARLRAAKGPRILTPHPGEAARLLACDVDAIQRDRYAAAQRIADDTGCVVVLKGACTLIAAPDGRGPWVGGHPHPALGTAGAGDVLTGLIAAFLCTLEPRIAAAAAVEVHSRAGALAASGDRGLLAHEIADAVPATIATVTR